MRNYPLFSESDWKTFPNYWKEWVGGKEWENIPDQDLSFWCENFYVPARYSRRDDGKAIKCTFDPSMAAMEQRSGILWKVRVPGPFCIDGKPSDKYSKVKFYHDDDPAKILQESYRKARTMYYNKAEYPERTELRPGKEKITKKDIDNMRARLEKMGMDYPPKASKTPDGEAAHAQLRGHEPPPPKAPRTDLAPNTLDPDSI
jgi:hypothetical protein